MKEKKISFQSDNKKIVGILNTPTNTPCPIVILLHGGTNTKDDCPMFDIIVKSLNKNGIATFRFDFFGTGESEGLFKEKNINILDKNINDAIDLIASNKKFTNIGLLGRSLSGGQVLYLNDNRIKTRVVHSASTHPFIDIERFYSDEINNLFSNPELKEISIDSDPRKVKGDYAYSRQFIEQLKIIPKKIILTMPKISNICIFQGDNDPETTVEDAIKIYNTVQVPKELHVMSNSNHKYIGVEDEVSFLTVNWFKKHL